MYSDELFKEMLNANAEVKNLFFSELNCDDCPCLREECAGRSCAEAIKLHYSECAETSSEKNEPTTEKEEPNIEKNEPAAANTQPHDIKTLIANYRKAKREYEDARDDIWQNLLDYMVKEAKSFTASELSDISGLPACTIAKMFGTHSRYLGYGKYVTFGVAYQRIPYVRLLPNGEVDMNKRNDKVQKVNSYLVTDK